jgi:carbamoyl-phosphate synthase large subunit
VKVLVSGAGGDIGQSIAKILRKFSLVSEIIGSDIHDEILAHDLFESISVLPPAFSPDYFECLNSCLTSEGVDLFIPTSEPELRWFSTNPEYAQSLRARVLMTSHEAMRICFDKLLTSEHLLLHGLPSPWSISVSDADAGPPKLPCILKSRTGSGGSSIYYLDEAENFVYYKKLFPDYIWQQFLPESKGEYTCGVYRCLDGSTRVITMRRRLSSGVTSYAEVVDDQSINFLCTRIAESLNLFGSINVQLRLVEELGPMVFEINPRFSSTVGMRHNIGFADVIWSIEEQFLMCLRRPFRVHGQA